MWFKAKITKIDDTVEIITLQADSLSEANAAVLSNNPDCKNVLVVCAEPPPP